MVGKNNKMLRNFLSIWWLCFVMYGAEAQNIKNLRLIAGYPNYKFDIAGGEYTEAYNSAIMKIVSDSLKQELLLSDSLSNLSFIRYNYSTDYIFVLLSRKSTKANSLANQGYELKVIDTNNLDTVNYMVPPYKDYNGFSYDLFVPKFTLLRKGKAVTCAFQYYNRNIPKESSNPRTLYYNLNPYNKILKPSNAAQYKNIIAQGSSATPYLFNNISGDGIILRWDNEEKKLKIPSTEDPDPSLNISLPKNFIPPKFNRASLIINSSKVSVFYLYEYTDSTMTCRILDKTNGSWEKLTIFATGHGGKLIIKNFGEWLVGCTHVSEGLPKNHKSKLPGEEDWSNSSTIYSPSVYRLKDLYEHFYSEGYLFLYNIHTKNYIEWNTGQADSEILMVRNNIVYYRKYDKIFFAPIINDSRLGKSTLIVSGKEVPAIHFMFFTEE